MTAIKQFDSTWQREGIWYLPGRENNSFYGSLKYNLENGFELSIIGSISENVFGLIGGRYPEIWGTTVDGINITIIDAISVGSTFNAPGFPTERIAAATGLVGCHVIEHNTRVQSFTTCIDRLAKWYGKSGIKKEYSSDEIGLKIPMSNKPLLQYLGSDRSVYFSFSRDFQGLNSGQVTISEKVWYGEYLFYPKRIDLTCN
jgi:hypothetical protein